VRGLCVGGVCRDFSPPPREGVGDRNPLFRRFEGVSDIFFEVSFFSLFGWVEILFFVGSKKQFMRFGGRGGSKGGVSIQTA